MKTYRDPEFAAGATLSDHLRVNPNSLPAPRRSQGLWGVCVGRNLPASDASDLEMKNGGGFAAPSVCRSGISERQFQRELNNPGIAGLGYLAKLVGKAEGRGGVAGNHELGVVEGVEELAPELKLTLFSEFEMLKDGQI